jgi:hypothetical protein
MTLKRAFVALLITVTVLVAAGIAWAQSGGSLEGSKPATARFHDPADANAAGYTVTVVDLAGHECIDQAGAGGMGVHLLNPALLDAEIDATQPEALVYEPAEDGRLKLAALEYIVFEQAWKDANGADAAAPSLFGEPFLLTPAPNRYGIPAFYALHSWIWKPNPTGLFEPWNPRVTCP